MDMTAITLCHENNIPIKVFNIKSSGDLIDIISGSNIGTTIGK
jgi:uridylate kinase